MPTSNLNRPDYLNGSLDQSGPDGPQGPPGVILKYDLLSNSQPGINYPNIHVGAFVAKKYPTGHVNNEKQKYVPEAAVQNPVKL